MGFIGMKPHEIEISPATIADMPAVCEIYNYSVLNDTASWEYDPPSIAQMQERFIAIEGGGFPFLVARRDNRVLGFAYASSYRSRVGYRFCVENSVYIDVAHRNLGIGSLLLNALICECTGMGFTQMIAVIGDSENIGSIKLHEKSGFVRVGLLPKIGLKFDKWLDSVLMQKDLTTNH